tara:strand:- start:3212 stop:3490 length:279 start_codon:yes stop_codon:yes gene_type:complete
MSRDRYLGTIAWDGYDSDTDGSITIVRNNTEDLIEGVIEYLDKLSGRGAYLECASIEMAMIGKNSKIDSEVEIARDITDTLKTIIKKRRSNG